MTKGYYWILDLMVCIPVVGGRGMPWPQDTVTTQIDCFAVLETQSLPVPKKRPFPRSPRTAKQIPITRNLKVKSIINICLPLKDL